MTAPMKSNVVLVSTTFYKSEDELRYKLTLDMAKTCKANGYTLVLVDASPISQVADTLKNLGAIVFQEYHKGMGPSRRQAYFHATEILKSIDSKDAKVIVWLEAQKEDLIRFIPDIVAPIFKGEADVVVPLRTATSWKSYPRFQEDSETQGNQFVQNLTRRNLDVFFGPVASSLSASHLVIKSDPKKFGYEDTYVPQFLATLALSKGLKVDSVEVDFQYPVAQKEEEEKNNREEFVEKRQKQLGMVTKAHEIILSQKKKKIGKQIDNRLVLAVSLFVLTTSLFLLKATR